MFERFRLAKKALKNQKGLTLIELLAVILILGILAAITIPVITGQGEGARISSHESNINSIESSAERYDLERQLEDEDFTILTESHPMIIEGYLEEVPDNPWEGTNSPQKDYVYIITHDARGVIHAYLAQVSGSTVQNILVVEDDETSVKTPAELSLTFSDSSLNTDYESMGEEDFLNQRFYHGN